MRRLFAVFALFSLTACSSGEILEAPATASTAGTYNLTSVDGAPLPFVAQASPKVELVSEQFVLKENGTFSETMLYRFTNGTSVTTQTLTDGGTYSISGSQVSLVFNSDGLPNTATLSGNTMVIAEPGHSYQYTKQ